MQSFDLVMNSLCLALLRCAASAPPPPRRSCAPCHARPGRRPARRPTGEEDDAAVPITARNPTWGSRTAPVTIVEFADFQCPVLRRVPRPTLSALREAYGPTRLRIVWKNNPLAFPHERAPRRRGGDGVSSRSAGRDAFWRFHDLAFRSGRSDLGATATSAWAQQAGVTDVDGLRGAGSDATSGRAQVDADSRRGRARSASTGRRRSSSTASWSSARSRSRRSRRSSTRSWRRPGEARRRARRPSGSTPSSSRENRAAHATELAPTTDDEPEDTQDGVQGARRHEPGAGPGDGAR